MNKDGRRNGDKLQPRPHLLHTSLNIEMALNTT